jgi:hypothetical protein
MAARARAEAVLPVSLRGEVRVREAPGVGPSVAWIPVVDVAEEGFLAEAGEELLAIDQAVLQQRLDDRALRVSVQQARLEVALFGLREQQRLAVEERQNVLLRQKQLAAERQQEVGAPSVSQELAAADLAMQEARVAAARRQLFAWQAQAEAGFDDPVALRHAERRVAEAEAGLRPVQIADALSRLELTSLSVALLDIEQQLLQRQLGADGELARRQRHLLAQTGAEEQLQGRALEQLHFEQNRDQTGLAAAQQTLPRAGLVQHRQGGVRPGVRLPTTTAVRVAAGDDLYIEAPVPSAVAAWWRQYPSAEVLVRSDAWQRPAQLVALSLRQHRRQPAQTIAQLRVEEQPLRTGQAVQVDVQLPIAGWSVPRWAIGRGGQSLVSGGRLGDQPQEIYLLGWHHRGRYFFADWPEQLNSVGRDYKNDEEHDLVGRAIPGFIQSKKEPTPKDLSALRWQLPKTIRDEETLWATVQPADVVPVQAPRSRRRGYYTWVIADATQVQAGQEVARIHAHWQPTAPDLQRAIQRDRQRAQAQVALDHVRSAQRRDAAEVAWMAERFQAIQAAFAQRQASLQSGSVSQARVDAALVRAQLQAQDAAAAVQQAEDPLVQKTRSATARRQLMVAAEKAHLQVALQGLERAAVRHQRDALELLTSERRLQQAQAEEQQARNAFVLARQRYRNELAVARRRFLGGTRGVARQQRRLSRLSVQAPATGTIYRQVINGQAVRVGSDIGSLPPLVVLTGDALAAVLEVPELVYHQWAPGQHVEVRLPGGKQYQAVVENRSPFCHPPRWREPAWPNERVATITVGLPASVIQASAPGEQIQIRRRPLAGSQSSSLPAVNRAGSPELPAGRHHAH